MVFEEQCTKCGRISRRAIDASRHRAKCGVHPTCIASTAEARNSAHLQDFALREAPASGMDAFQGTPSTGDVDVDENSSLSEEDHHEAEEQDVADDDDADLLLGISDNTDISAVTDTGGSSAIDLQPVSYLQYKAAVYICTSGIQRQGLSVLETGKYLNSLDPKGEVCFLWRSGKMFWTDHAHRQKLALEEFGKWESYVVKTERADIGDYTAYVRNLPKTILGIIRNSKSLTIDGRKVQNWTEHLNLKPCMKFDTNGRRIVTDFHSGDDLLYLHEIMTSTGVLQEKTLVPVQLFVDKANVTRLNKRLMYPVIMYLLGFSRKVTGNLAVNVGFIPIVRKNSIAGRRLSKDIVRSTRRIVTQSTLVRLLSPLNEKVALKVLFPDGVEREIKPILLSIVADMPEVALLTSCRMSDNTAHPCGRCFISLAAMNLVDTRTQLLKTTTLMKSIYASVASMGTKTEKEQYLKEKSLHLPASVLMDRFECCLGSSEMRNQVVSRMSAATASTVPNPADLLCDIGRKTCSLVHARPFSFHSFCKFESMHNFDIGYTKDILQSIGTFFAVCLKGDASSAILDKANHHQVCLPRRSQTGTYRLPKAGAILAPGHANVTAQNLYSSLAVLPFLLKGSEKGIGGAAKIMHYMLDLVLSYIHLHHFVRRINTLPWHVYSTVHGEISVLNTKFYQSYENSIGRAKGRAMGSGLAPIGRLLATPKVHQLYCHLAFDIMAGGNVQNFDAQLGESHHVGTRAHYNRSTKTGGAEEQVARRATTRELGVLQRMYLCNEPKELSANEGAVRVVGLESNGEEPTKKKRKRSLTKLTSSLIDGESVLNIVRGLRGGLESRDVPVFRMDFDSVRVVQTVEIKARYPWLQNHGVNGKSVETVRGLKQLVRAASAFYNEEPQYDFVQYVSGSAKIFGQVRLLFEQPYEDKIADHGPFLALVRTLKAAEGRILEKGVEEDEEWGIRNTNLLESAGCTYLQWDIDDRTESYRRAVINVKSILCPVSIVPDFQCPIIPEKGSKLWNEMTAVSIEKDRRRFEREERASNLMIDRGRKNNLNFDDTSIAETKPVRLASDGPSELPHPKEERFFYNPFMPWTTPENK